MYYCSAEWRSQAMARQKSSYIVVGSSLATLASKQYSQSIQSVISLVRDELQQAEYGKFLNHQKVQGDEVILG